ncbi:hypothetical protein ACFVYR_20725 [Streptomyces sp. NPDC058284]|uniref:hypothetical protein n=1 Tax=unclassified Streptomyces TaxID=2593676 RepID=UPI0036628FC8
MTDQPEGGRSFESDIRRISGDAFVDWILAVESGSGDRSPEQQQVISTVHQLAQELPADVSLPAHFRLARLLHPSPGSDTLLANDLRLLAGGAPPVLPEPAGDAVLAALQAWVAECFGGLLLGDSGLGLGWSTPARARLDRMVAADSTLPFTTDSTSEQSVWIDSSTGGQTMQLAGVGPSIAVAAFRQAALRRPPQLEDLLQGLPQALRQARNAYAEQEVQATGLAGLTGILLPDQKQEIITSWGRVRATRRTDNLLAQHGGGTAAAESHLDDGTVIRSQGTGDLTIECSVPWGAKVTLHAGDETPPMRATTHPGSHQELARRAQQVRLAFTLTMNSPSSPALLPTWSLIESPTAPANGFSYTELARLRHRTPTRISVEQAEEWERWITALDAAPLTNLGHAPQRLLRAVTERFDSTDALVDAVIVWESIFGTHAEITFRVCASLARLLYPTLEERRAFFKLAKGVYDMRSRIVHGAQDITPKKIDDARDLAITTATLALRELITNRRDLLELRDSPKRSEQILLE